MYNITNLDLARPSLGVLDILKDDLREIGMVELVPIFMHNVHCLLVGVLFLRTFGFPVTDHSTNLAVCSADPGEQFFFASSMTSFTSTSSSKEVSSTSFASGLGGPKAP
jgi:hypothetical protein